MANEIEKRSSLRELLKRNNSQLEEGHLTPQTVAFKRAVNLVIKYTLGEDIRTEEDYRNRVNRLFDELEINNPSGAAYLQEEVGVEYKRVGRSRVRGTPIIRMMEIRRRIQSGKINDLPID